MAVARNALSKPRGYAYNALQTATEQKSEPHGSLYESLSPRMAKLDIHLLGEFSLTYNDAPLTTVNTQRLQELFAYLVLNRHAPQTRQRVAPLMWPDSDDPQALTNLRNLLHSLRRALPEYQLYLNTEGQTPYWKNDAPYRLDVEDFEKAALDHAHSASLERAVHLYRGELLPGFYSDWILRERERLDTLYTDTLVRLIRALAGNGTNDRALEYAQRLKNHDPLREDAYRYLMQLYARLGNRAKVQSTFRECVDNLERELDVEPSAETKRAYEEALRYEPPLLNPPLPAPAPVIDPPRAEPILPKKAVSGFEMTRRQKDLLAYGVALGVPLLVLVGLLLIQAPPVLALGVTVLLFGGLFLGLVYRPGVELEKQKLHDEIMTKLEAIRSKIADLRALAHGVGKPETQARVLRICERAEKLLNRLQDEKRVTLAVVTRLDSIFGETRQILSQYVRICDGQMAADPAKLADIQERIETLLSELEQALGEFAVDLDRGDMAALEAAIRVLENTLKNEGMR